MGPANRSLSNRILFREGNFRMIMRRMSCTCRRQEVLVPRLACLDTRLRFGTPPRHPTLIMQFCHSQPFQAVGPNSSRVSEHGIDKVAPVWVCNLHNGCLDTARAMAEHACGMNITMQQI